MVKKSEVIILSEKKGSVNEAERKMAFGYLSTPNFRIGFSVIRNCSPWEFSIT